MEKVIIEIPTMYGDHHVLEVRKILLSIPGVQDVYASSAFGFVEVSYDPSKVNDLEIKMKLDEAGYLGEWNLPRELSIPATEKSELAKYFRHSEVFEATKEVISFTQNLPYYGRPLWPCPGMGVIRAEIEE
ncbi:MAG: heavy-metal-associated domain-containing protein [Anaerolineales bacterium]|nr:heavy-metal-associated domain-containing protein [Anaerolineales bacterium]MDW8160872.1 heavy-metal-associated domain-containing protein [Anaerolineales bacterium]